MHGNYELGITNWELGNLAVLSGECRGKLPAFGADGADFGSFAVQMPGKAPGVWGQFVRSGSF